jgi:hypothetical protein
MSFDSLSVRFCATKRQINATTTDLASVTGSYLLNLIHFHLGCNLNAKGNKYIHDCDLK